MVISIFCNLSQMQHLAAEGKGKGYLLDIFFTYWVRVRVKKKTTTTKCNNCISYLLGRSCGAQTIGT